MNFFFLIFLTFFCGLFSVVFNNKFFLSLLISLEIILINLMAFVFYLNIIQSDVSTLIFAPYILTFSAIEASIGISLMTLLSRNSNTNNLNLLNVLKS
uniref:NADH-ubiquinone oxidoreductase chain 4L n=1 Tax=Histampica haimaensis TaxID=2839059 RepID=A0A8K1K6H2_9ECHI|nr:NADH dehydrogenase subunit 4L [Histampica sp. h LQ-2021]WKW95569.1 NADH dehydrogenase subunit 4L [Histampica sp. CS049]